MKVLNPIELARQALLPAQDKETDEQQRVLQLFRNRAELKKAYSELQDEIHRLKDRLKQQEGATARMREMLEHLEGRLGSPETGYPTLVFFQLRSLWAQGSELLRGFGNDLERQHVERERRAFVAEVNRRQFARRQEVESRLRSAEADAAEGTQRTAALNRSLASLNRPWHHFKRRRLQRDLVTASAQQAAADAALADARHAVERVLSEGEVEFPGLSVEARRAVNVAVIAYADLLVLRLSKTALLSQARAAVLRREPSDEYGDRSECEALMADIARASGLLADRTNLAQDIKARAEKLHGIAKYRGDDDAVPTPESVVLPVEAPAPRTRGTVAPSPPPASRPLSVLGDDVWDIFKVLLR